METIGVQQAQSRCSSGASSGTSTTSGPVPISAASDRSCSMTTGTSDGRSCTIDGSSPGLSSRIEISPRELRSRIEISPRELRNTSMSPRPGSMVAKFDPNQKVVAKISKHTVAGEFNVKWLSGPAGSRFAVIGAKSVELAKKAAERILTGASIDFILEPGVSAQVQPS